jgi:hypothetical protein
MDERRGRGDAGIARLTRVRDEAAARETRERPREPRCPRDEGWARAREGETRGAGRANMRRARIIEMDCARTRRDRAAIRVRVPRGSETDRAWSVVPGNGVSEGFSSAFSTCSRSFRSGTDRSRASRSKGAPSIRSGFVNVSRRRWRRENEALETRSILRLATRSRMMSDTHQSYLRYPRTGRFRKRFTPRGVSP